MRGTRCWLVAASVLSLATPALATGEAVNGFPNWQERVMHEWTNRARCDPQVEMSACGTTDCPEGACYTAQKPLPWNEALNHSARFHCDEMKAQNYFAHNSQCTLVSNIDSLFPGSCTGAASCACVGGTQTCNTVCTTWNGRVSLFGGSPTGEIIASYTDPNSAFYQWLFEPYNSTQCGYNQGPPTNGHRYNILMSGPSVGYGEENGGASVGDFGGGGTMTKLVSGSHYPRNGATVDAWANWYDTAGPTTASIDIDGTCTTMTLDRGSSTNGAYHAALTGMSTGCHRYFFYFKDSSNTVVTYPSTGSLGIGPSGTCADWDTSRPADCGAVTQDAGAGDGGSSDGGSSGDASSGDSGSGSDGGSGNPDAASGGDAGGGADGGTGGGGGGGCGCTVAGADAARFAAIPWVLGLLVWRLRRRRTT